MNPAVISNSGLVGDLVGTIVASDSLAALERVDWSIRAGDYWVLAAWAESGKRNLLATLAGLQRPLAGRCVLLECDLYRLDAAGLLELRRRIGFVYDDGGRLFNDLTLAENIALPVAYHSNRSLAEVLPEVASLFPVLGLESVAGRLPAQVSRAWRQRAALARALAMKPEILLLLDPIAGLDARHVRWWREFLAQLNFGHPYLDRRPLTLVVATDDLRLWADHARQFAVIQQRRLRTFRSRAEFSASEPSWFQEWEGPAIRLESQETMESKS
jgi:ABC-type sulfate/molybdate transport systems ATPase subunit